MGSRLSLRILIFAFLVATGICSIVGSGGGGGGGSDGGGGGGGGAPTTQNVVFAFSEGTGNAITSSGALALEGQITGGAQWVQGRAGNALSFANDGSRAHLSYGSAAQLDSQQLTVEAWIKPHSVPTDQTSLIVGVYFSWKLQLANGKPEFWIDYGLGSEWAKLVSWNTVLIPDTWYHISVTYNGGQAKMYINGVLVDSSSRVYTISYAYSFGQYYGDMYIGGCTGCCGFIDYIHSFPGVVEDVRVYAKVLSDADIVHDYNTPATGGGGGSGATPTPQNVVFSFPEGSGSTTTCSGTTVLQGEITGGAQWVPGRAGNGLSFENGGSQTHILYDSSAQLDSQQLTVEAWIKPHSVPTDQTSLIAGVNFSWKLQLANGKPEFWIDYGLGSEWAKVVSWNTVLAPDTWYHIAVTHVGGQAKMYVNGVLVDSSPLVYTISYTYNFGQYYGEMYMGGSTGCCQFQDYVHSFPGVIDNVRIYTTVRSGAEIAYDYNNSQ